MTIPSLIFAFLIASLYGALYHLIRGGRLGRLLLFLILGWAGFVGISAWPLAGLVIVSAGRTQFWIVIAWQPDFFGCRGLDQPDSSKVGNLFG